MSVAAAGLHRMEGDFQILRLEDELAAQAWPKAAPLLEPAIALTSGLYELEDIGERIRRPGSGWSLWIIAEQLTLLGAWTTHVVEYPRARVLMVGFAGGSGFRRYHRRAIGATEEFALSIGCTRLHGGGRRGWQRFGFQQIGVWNERILR
jgi:hypothetical protein